jgi:hypothetical protein
MHRRKRSILGIFDQTLLDRIAPASATMRGEVFVAANMVLPKPALPDP